MAFGEVDRPCERAGEFVPICSSDRGLRLEGVDGEVPSQEWLGSRFRAGVKQQ